MKIFLILLSLSCYLFSLQNEPVLKFEASGPVVDIHITKEKLYAATKLSCVDIFDLKTAQKINKIEVPKIVNFMGQKSDSKVYSLDVLNGSVVLLSQSDKGFRRVHIVKDEKLKLLISKNDEMYISEVKFLDEKNLILGLLSNEIISFNIEKKSVNWRVQVSQSKFSDFVLNESRDRVVVADESGELKILNTNTGVLIERLSGQNLDNVFQVDYKNGIIATAGQDRRVVIYDVENFIEYYKTSSFLIYSVGLSPSGVTVAYASDENNNVTLFDTVSKKEIGIFTGNTMTLNKILFLNESEFLVASDARVINLFKVK
ncbi:WD40 repeat domain-containing protein [Sulfurimonas aquatica]|uniref:WD40 repeat domain-containing protein n=1 Tax=Sulfurimonas aquatica TaxID=2672570 RepID=A0A975B1D1_9BACT|nr:WD40 repeat domain-containing protein [Sulfurimonas aquatica]QSZ42318.1 WD40 repeat domain-containing protein [Sulfurimonas aquatica]